MSESADPHTLLYLSLLPLALATLPSFSAAASQTLRPLQAPLRSSTQSLKCGTCQAELVAGLSGSCWVDRGELWATCDGCGWTSRRSVEGKTDTGSQASTGRSNFERVKKRRRVDAKRSTEVAHPTFLAGKQEAAFDEAVGASIMRNLSAKSRSASVVAEGTPSKASTPSTPALAEPGRLPASSRDASRIPSEKTVSTSTSANPWGASTARPSPTPTSARPSPAPSDSTAGGPSSKKRRRPKQPTGLAEMLEAKKRKEEATSGGAGLADFLQGL